LEAISMSGGKVEDACSCYVPKPEQIKTCMN